MFLRKIITDGQLSNVETRETSLTAPPVFVDGAPVLDLLLLVALAGGPDEVVHGPRLVRVHLAEGLLHGLHLALVLLVPGQLHLHSSVQGQDRPITAQYYDNAADQYSTVTILNNQNSVL